MYTPPPRPKEHQEHLWAAVKSDVLSVISTDHCAFLWDGQKSLGKDDFSKIPNGGPGIEDRLMMIHQFGVREGRISLNRMVELLATSPAKLFGLYPRKGTVAVGSDADLVVFDPEQARDAVGRALHSKCDYNLYEGTEVQGAPEVVLLRGQRPRRGGRARRPAGHGPVREARASSATASSRRAPRLRRRTSTPVRQSDLPIPSESMMSTIQCRAVMPVRQITIR